MRKNVLILGHNGATQFIDIFNQYTRLFDKNQYDVTVAYLTGEPTAAIQERTIAENVIFLNIPKKSVRGLKIGAIRQLLALTREKQFEIVICHRYKPSYIMMMVNRFHHIPALFLVMHELKTMSSFGRQLLLATLARQPNIMFAGVSDAVRDDLRRYLWGIPAERIITLYNMIDIPLTEPQLYSRSEARAALHLAEDDIVFGHLARLVPNKDQATLIRAFARMKATCPKAKLVMIGCGQLEADLRAQAKASGIDQDILFTGFLEGGFRYMKAFDCFVLSSVQEAFGRVLLEAMVAKLPMIATRTHGIPEVVGDAGTLIEPGDDVAFAKAMQHIYALPASERAQLGDRAYQRAVNHFSIPCFQSIFWSLPLIQSLKD